MVIQISQGSRIRSNGEFQLVVVFVLNRDGEVFLPLAFFDATVENIDHRFERAERHKPIGSVSVKLCVRTVPADSVRERESVEEDIQRIDRFNDSDSG
jgi:hypothetical protein